MKNLTFFPFLLFCLMVIGCTNNEDYFKKEVTALNNNQLDELLKGAIEIEEVGEPIKETSVVVDTASNITITNYITTQNIKFQIVVDENNRPVPDKDKAIALKRANNGRFGVGTVSCSSSCKSLIVGQGCGVGSGCSVSGQTCTTPSCPSGCSSFNCTKTSTGLVFGAFIQ